MTTEQQFSKEYIAFMQSDEAKALQKGREFGIGDWYIPRPERPEPQLIKNRLDMSCRDVRWIKLFTLFQLIRVIEGAGWRVSMRSPVHGVPGRDRWMVMGTPPSGSARAEIHNDDLLLAAAQLAVRAVEDV